MTVQSIQSGPQRDRTLKRQAERLARMLGFEATALVGTGLRNGCQVTRDGVVLLIGADEGATVALRKGPGVQGELTISDADTMMLLQLVAHALNFEDASYYSHMRENADDDDDHRYFDFLLDDMVADAWLMRLPYFRRCYRAYISRAIPHDMSDKRMARQFLQAVRLHVLEGDPALTLAPPVSAYLSSEEGKEVVSQASQLVFDETMPYQQRHKRAECLLYEIYGHFASLDRLAQEGLNLLDLVKGLMPRFMAEGVLDVPDPMAAFQTAGRIRRIIKHAVEEIEENLTRKAEQRSREGSDAGSGEEAAHAEEDSTMATTLLVEGMVSSSWLDVSGGYHDRYQLVIDEWHDTIEQVASVFSDIASRSEVRNVPRYRARLADHGRRMSPKAILQAKIMLDLNRRMPIWQPMWHIERQGDAFGGLDFFLLLDTSLSMRGERARYASVMSTCLMEGLQLSIAKSKTNPLQRNVDIRAQILAFGVSASELSPLSSTFDRDQKEQAFGLVLNARSTSTRICDALRKVRESYLRDPSRSILCLVVSDGRILDGERARQMVADMPDNAYVGHINIGDFEGDPITPHCEAIRDPGALPEKLKEVLEGRLEETIDRSL